MRSPAIKRQSGYVLILTLVAFMGIGGAVIAGYTQQAKDSTDARRAEHNRKVLAEAKQALLMYAYNYPDNNLEGPGRLPCPDTDDDGLPGVPGPPALTLAICQSVGRFPWADPEMNFYDARDASGERLWYAVSDQFYNLGGGGVINSNRQGSITLVDQSGEIIYDGSANGIAAVIIAPGSIGRRDEDNDGNYEYVQLRATGLQQLNPANYLDTLSDPGGGGSEFDNGEFNNSEADSNEDGFIHGPIFDPTQGMIVVNDQIAVVTADEVLEMAEKKVLETYRDALAAYRANVPGNIYPWLDDFATNSLTEYDADINSFKGHMPALFGNYFAANTNPTPPIISDLRLTLRIDDLVISRTVGASVTPDIFFDSNGDLVTNFSPGSITYYFWDGHPSQTPTLPMDGNWTLCPGTTGTEEDCNLDTSGNWKGPASTASDVWLQVRRVTVTINSIDDPFEFALADLNALPVIAPTVGYTPAGTGTNAYVFREYNNNSGYLTVFNEYDQDFMNSFDVAPGAGNLVFNGTDRYVVGMIYYPELPFWAIGNDWHHSVQLAIAEDYKPDGNNADCTINGCLVVNNLGGTNNDKVSLFVIAGEVDSVDEAADGFLDDFLGQFAAENDTANVIYDRLAENDRVMVVQ